MKKKISKSKNETKINYLNIKNESVIINFNYIDRKINKKNVGE